MGAVKKAMLEELWKEQKQEEEEQERWETQEALVEALEEDRLIEESIQDQLE